MYAAISSLRHQRSALSGHVKRRLKNEKLWKVHTVYPDYFFPVFMIPLYFWAVLVGFSRVVLGVHFPTDTLVGCILGLSTAFFSLGQVI